MSDEMFPDSFNTESVSHDDMLKEIDRELAMRKRLYPAWVTKGTLKQATADRQILIMEAVREVVRGARQNRVMTTMSGKRID